MPWHVQITDSNVWDWNSPEAQENADLIASELVRYGWSLPAICGMLANASHESYLNPGQYELGHGTPTNPYGYGYGVGLIQWTSPDGGYSWPNPWLYYCQYKGIEIADPAAQCEMINGCDNLEYTQMDLSTTIWGWINDSSFPEHDSFENFKTYTGDDIEREAKLWYWMVERPDPTDPTLPRRLEAVHFWWDYFGGHPIPPGPGPEPSKKKKMPLWMYLRKF